MVTKSRWSLWAAAGVLAAVAAGAWAAEKAPAKPAEKPPVKNTVAPGITGAARPFLCSDNVGKRILRISAAGQIEWEHPAAHPQDVWVLPSGNVLFSHVRGAIEVTPDAAKRIVWEYKSPEKTEVHSCQPLADGAVLIAECGTSRFIEVGRDGAIRKELKIATTSGLHRQFRIVRKLANGHYLAALNGEKLVREYDADGKVLRTIAVPGDPYLALRLPNGNTLISCGDGHKVIEVDPQDKVVWELGENDLPGVPIRFAAGLQRLPNGNTVVANWGGHGHLGEQPQVVEVTPDKKVVWQVNDWKQWKTISGIQVLDVPGDVTKGEVLR